MALLWRQDDTLTAALDRLRLIRPDPAAGRAARDAILPQFEGIDQWIPRLVREALSAAVSSGAIAIERSVLKDGPVTSPHAREHLACRCTPSSPLYRAAGAVIADWEQRGIDPLPGPSPRNRHQRQGHPLLRRVRLAVLHVHTSPPDEIRRRRVARNRPPYPDQAARRPVHPATRPPAPRSGSMGITPQRTAQHQHAGQHPATP